MADFFITVLAFLLVFFVVLGTTNIFWIALVLGVLAAIAVLSYWKNWEIEWEGWASYRSFVSVVVVLVVIVGGICRIYGCYKERDRKVEEEKRVASEEEVIKQNIEKEKQRKADEAAVRTFALKEAPSMWRTYEGLNAIIEQRRLRLDVFRKRLEERGMKADDNKDYKELERKLKEMISNRETLWQKMGDACTQADKFEADGGDIERVNAQKALKDGMEEAEAITTRYKEMCRGK